MTTDVRGQNKLKIAIVDDETVFAEKLRKKAEGFFSSRKLETEIFCFSDGAPLLSALENGERFDIVFLDIQLETSDGMDIAAALRKYDRNAAVIFVTGLSDRAAEGYGVEAFDYIVKTRLNDRLETVLERFIERPVNKSLVVSLDNGSRAVIPFRQLYAVVSEGRGTALYTESKKIYTASPVGKISPGLSERDYFEVHKGVYVRIEMIRSIDADTLKICDGTVFPVSRRRRKPLLCAVMERAKGEWK